MSLGDGHRSGREAAAPIPGDVQTVAHLVEARAVQHPHRCALADSSRRLTYAELEVATARWADALHAVGLRPGDRLGASMANSVDLTLSHLGAMRAGLVWVGVSRASAPPEREHVLAHSGAALLLVDDVPLDPPGDCPSMSVLAPEWARLLADCPAVERPAIDPFAPAAIAFTSGTTGQPKGAVHSQRNMLLPGVVARTNGDGHGIIGMYLPMTSLNMQVLGPVYALVNATTCVCIDRRDAVSLAELIARERIERVSASAATVHDLVTDPAVTAEALSSLTALTVGGSAAPEWLFDAYSRKFGRRFLAGYGLSEAPASVTRERADRPHAAGGSGVALSQFQLAVLDDRGRAVARGEVGEICVRAAVDGPFAQVYTTMLGYWADAAASALVVRDGWVRTGDIGRLGPDDELFVEDRRVDLIVRGGSNVYPAEVERVVLADPRVAGCAVVGRAHPRLGHVPIALVQLRPGAVMTPDEVLAACAAALARYKVPVEARFVAELPRNPMGKILREPLRALVALAPDSAPAPAPDSAPAPVPTTDRGPVTD